MRITKSQIRRIIREIAQPDPDHRELVLVDENTLELLDMIDPDEQDRLRRAYGRDIERGEETVRGTLVDVLYVPSDMFRKYKRDRAQR